MDESCVSAAASCVKVTKCLTPSHDQCVGEYYTDDILEQKFVIKCDCICHKKAGGRRKLSGVECGKGCEPYIHTNATHQKTQNPPDLHNYVQSNPHATSRGEMNCS